MREQDVNLVVLDCIGYSLKMQSVLQQETGRPVLLPRTVLAGAIKERLEASR
jgi:protein AroM